MGQINALGMEGSTEACNAGEVTPPNEKKRAREGCVIERGQKRGFFLLDRRTPSRGFLPCKWNRLQEALFLVNPNQTVSEAHAQSKDASQTCVKRPIEGCNPSLCRKRPKGQSKELKRRTLVFLQNFVKIIFLSVFFLFDSFLLILVLENPNALIQAWTLRILVRKALIIESANFGVQHHPYLGLKVAL